jgi:predicted naringenin-chalcone synthase
LAFINTIAQSLPTHQFAQQTILSFMENAFTIPDSELGKVRAMYARGGIDYRYSVLPDFDVEQSPILFTTQEPSMQERMQVYMQSSLPLSVNACLNLHADPKEITHLITVSCTGMSAPGLDILLMRELQLNANIQRTSVNFMGCYALTHALKLANAFCTENINAKVMIVLVELCTLHFQQEYSLENVATSMLFADGCAAMIVSNQPSKTCLEIKSFYSEVHGNSLSDMSWNLTDKGFKMTLSAYVPSILADNISPLLNNALQQQGIAKNDIRHWALHPGGKKIIHEISKALQLTEQDTAISRSVLQQFGNMSSVTLAIVLKQIMESCAHNDYIFGCAFGPGLTMESLIVKAWSI